MQSEKHLIYAPFAVSFALGILAANFMTILNGAFRAMGWSSLNFELLIGSLLAGENPELAYWLGYALHCLLGGVFGLIYALAFSFWRAGPILGAFFGFVHWIFIGLLFSFIPWEQIPAIEKGVHPIPGLMGSGLGWGSTVVFLVGHIVFGMVLAAGFERHRLTEAEDRL